MKWCGYLRIVCECHANSMKIMQLGCIRVDIKAPWIIVITTKWRNFLFLCMHIVAITAKITTRWWRSWQKKPIMFYLSIHLLYKYPDVIYVNDLHRNAQIRWTTALPLIENFQDIDEIEIFAYTLLRNPSICGSVSHSDFDSFNAIVIKNLWQTHAYTQCMIKKNRWTNSI